MNKTLLRWIKFSVATFLVAMFFFGFIRQWTEIPRYHIIYISADQDALNTSKGLSDYLSWGTTFAFFTTLSNIIAITIIFIEWASFGKFKFSKKIKIGALLYMIVTALIFWTSIAPFMPWGFDYFFDYDNVHEHLIVLIAIVWFTTSDKSVIKSKKSDYIYVLIFPLAYLIMSTSILLVTSEHIAIYTFLDFYDWFALGMALWLSILVTTLFILVLLFIFVVAYFLLVKVSNHNKENSKGYNTIKGR